MSAVQKELERLDLVIKEAKQTFGKHIEGFSKFIRQCDAEHSFIKTLNPQDPNIVNKLSSTNTNHLEALLQKAQLYRSNLCAFLRKVKYRDHQSTVQKTITIDIVLHQDQKEIWVKVVARNPKALHNIWRGYSESSATPLTDQAVQYLSCAALNHYHFNAPAVRFHIVRGVTRPLALELERLGVEVVAPEIIDIPPEEEEEDDSDDVDEDCCYPALSPEEESTVESLQVEKILTDTRRVVNLDVTALMVLVTDLCHVGPPTNRVFRDPSHQTMAEEERSTPALKIMNEEMEGCRVVVCETAWAEFDQIVRTVGGPNELARATGLISGDSASVDVVPDGMSERARNIQTTSKIREKNKIVFGTGDALRAVTLTANSGLVRAATHQNVNFAVFIHASRALTEKARYIEDSDSSSGASDEGGISPSPNSRQTVSYPRADQQLTNSSNLEQSNIISSVA